MIIHYDASCVSGRKRYGTGRPYQINFESRLTIRKVFSGYFWSDKGKHMQISFKLLFELNIFFFYSTLCTKYCARARALQQLT